MCVCVRVSVCVCTLHLTIIIHVDVPNGIAATVQATRSDHPDVAHSIPCTDTETVYGSLEHYQHHLH